MAMKDEHISRGHELYLRHILLLGKAVPLALKAVISNIEAKHGKKLDSILTEKRDTIKTFYYDLFQTLFKEDDGSVNTEIESWGLSTLCGVIFVLSESSELDCVSCISGQLRDVEKYTHSDSLEYDTYKHKWESLRESLFELVKGSKAEYECKRLIHLYDGSEAIKVSKDVIKELKQTGDVDKHIHLAISSEFALDRQSEMEDDPLRGKEYNNMAEQTTVFIQPLSDIVVHEDESVVLSCELNTAVCQTEWRKNDEPLLETKSVKVLADKGYQWLVFARAMPEDTGKYSCIYKNVLTSAFLKVSKQDLMVVEALHVDVDGQAIENMDISLVCTVNAHTKNPKWFHNNKEITQTSRVVAVSQGLDHKLIIRNVKFEDEGLYVIAFDRVTSCTRITVNEQDLMVVEALHIDGDGQVKENMDISLVCTVNAHTKNIKWFHNNKEITQTSRVVAVSQGLEHKLIIRNVKFEDEGLYVIAFDRVTSCTGITVKGEADLSVKLQLSEKLYTNWVRGVLGLKYLKLGLEGVAEKVVKCRHAEMLKNLPHLEQPCTQCSTDSLYHWQTKKQFYRKQNKNRWQCPNGGYCSLFYDQIVSDHRFEHSEMENTQLDRWSSDHWSVATCYINTKGYKGKRSSKEIDCAGLLSLFINNRRYLTDANYGVFDMARTTRNEILHNANYELSEGQLHKYLDNFKDVLEVKNNANEVVLANDESVKEASKAIDKLRQHQIDILTLEEIKNLKDHAMKEAADIFKEARKKKDQEFQHLKEKLKKTEMELQMIRQLRSAFQRDSRLMEQKESLELVLRLGIRVVTPLGESSSEVIQRVYWCIQYSVENNKILGEDSFPPNVQTYKNTFKSVQQILGKIFVSQDTQVEVLQNDLDVSVKIQCISTKDLEKRLTIFHGVHFLEAIADLRKSLETEDERKRKYDVETCCCSQNLKDITKQLFDHGVLKGPSSDYRCENHDGTQCSWYCGEHEKLFCKSCKENNHRSCLELKKLEDGERQGKLILKQIQFKTPKTGFKISFICTLPNGDVLIGSRHTADLLKLDSSYYPISRCVLPSSPSGVCYVGNGRTAAVCENKLVFLDLTSNRVSHESLLPSLYIQSIACHGDMIYTYDGKFLYTCNTDGINLRTVYSVRGIQSNLEAAKCFMHIGSNFACIAISDNGETIYIIDGLKLRIIDSNGDLLSTKDFFSLHDPVGICCVGNGSLIVCYSFGLIKQLYFKGDHLFGENVHMGNSIMTSLCYDRKLSRLVVGCEKRLFVSDIEYTV